VKTWRPETQAPQPVTWLAPAIGETPLELAYATQRAIPRQYGKFLDNVERVKDQLSPEGLKQQLANFASSEAGGAAIDRTEKLATEHREAAESAYNAAVNAVSAPGDTAAELRNTRAADGAVRQLERLPAGERTQAAKAILEATNREQLGAVVEAITTVGVHPGVVETLVAQQLSEVVAHAKQVAEVRKQETVLRHNASRLREHVREGRRLQVRLVDPNSLRH
jgi:hypothetical protein